MLRKWIRRKILIPIRSALKNGMSQRKLAISLALGIILGLIPFYGLTTILVGVVAFALRLDMVVMQAVHYIVHPIQIALFIPFFKAGNFFLSDSTVDFTFKEYISLFKSDFWMALNELWKVNLSAIAIWIVISIPMFYLLYYALLYSIKRYGSLLTRKPACKAA